MAAILNERPEPASESSEADWHGLWFSTVRQGFKSIAIVPVDWDLAPERLAQALADAGRLQGVTSVRRINAVKAQPTDVRGVTESIRELTHRGTSLVVAVDPVVHSPAALPIACATDAFILVVRIGESSVASVRQTINAIGRHRLVGSIVIG
jgi:hypothetical protein